MDIREVARRGGVSVATVSRALNNRPDVSRSTRERILAIAAEVGYQPNHQARALVRRRSDLVGLIWDTGYLSTRGRHPFLQDLLVGLKIAFAGTGRHLLLLSTPESQVDAYAQIARQHSLEGVILMGVDEGHPSISALLDSGIPCVAVDLPLHGSRASYVTSDNRAGAASAVQHLHSLGHRRIATICGPLDLMPGAERLAGYRYQTARLGLPFREEYVERGDFFLASGRACMRRLLALPEPPTAVFAAGDEMAIGALDVLAEAGISVPGQMSVVGYDDVEAAALVRPALTTVAQDSRKLAAAAAHLLTDILGDGDFEGAHRQIASRRDRRTAHLRSGRYRNDTTAAAGPTGTRDARRPLGPPDSRLTDAWGTDPRPSARAAGDHAAGDPAATPDAGDRDPGRNTDHSTGRNTDRNSGRNTDRNAGRDAAGSPIVRRSPSPGADGPISCVTESSQTPGAVPAPRLVSNRLVIRSSTGPVPD